MRVYPAELEPVLRTILGSSVVEDTEVDPNYSLRFRPHDQGRTRAHALFRGCETLARSRSPRRVITALLRFLEASAMEADGRYLQLEATALVSGRHAVIAPASLRAQLSAAEDELQRRGLGCIDGPVHLDPDRAEVVVLPPPPIPIDSELLPDGPPTPEVEHGRFPVSGWAWHMPAGGRDHPPAEVVERANRLVRNRVGVGGQRALEALASIASAKARWLPPGRTATPKLLDLLAPQ